MQAAKIGRNDPCSCGSGKKYKFCCVGKAEQAGHHAGIPFQTAPEAFALGRLLTAAKPFRAFYDSERPKIVGDIYWTNSVPMPPGLEVQAIRLPTTKLQVIYLRQIPAAPQGALAVAHELMHLVLDAEGFPFVTSASQNQALAALLNSVSQDALIDARLRKYGFPIAKKVEREIRGALASLGHAAPPLDPLGRLMWALTYAGHVLECGAASSGGVDEQLEPFRRWFHSHHPSITADGDAILAVMRRLDFTTPDGMHAFFAWITRRYRLSDDFVISVTGHVGERAG